MKVCDAVSAGDGNLREPPFVDWGCEYGGTWLERFRKLAVRLRGVSVIDWGCDMTTPPVHGMSLVQKPELHHIQSQVRC